MHDHLVFQVFDADNLCTGPVTRVIDAERVAQLVFEHRGGDGVELACTQPNDAVVDEDPRDVDLVVPVPDDLFLAMYNSGAPADLSTWSSGQREANPSKMWRLWARDCAKQSRNATMFVQRTVDFKTQPQTYFDTYSALPRVRLDCAFVPDEARP